MLLAESLLESQYINGQAFNFGPNLDQNKSVHQLVLKLNEFYGGHVEIPANLISDDKVECNLLKLNCEKSFHILNWSPKLFEEYVNILQLGTSVGPLIDMKFLISREIKYCRMMVAVLVTMNSPSFVDEFPLQRISLYSGDVYRYLKQSDNSFRVSGEVYFSFIKTDILKLGKNTKR